MPAILFKIQATCHTLIIQLYFCTHTVWDFTVKISQESKSDHQIWKKKIMIRAGLIMISNWMSHTYTHTHTHTHTHKQMTSTQADTINIYRHTQDTKLKIVTSVCDSVSQSKETLWNLHLFDIQNYTHKQEGNSKIKHLTKQPVGFG